MIEEIFKSVLEKQTGVDSWITLVCAAMIVISWLLIGATKRQEKKVRRTQIGIALLIVLVGGGLIFANHLVFQREPVFLKNSTGILIMRFAGDDAVDSLQNDLVNKLNAELQNEAAGQQVEVHAGRENWMKVTVLPPRTRSLG